MNFGPETRPTWVNVPTNDEEWSRWIPRDEGVLCFVVRDGRILLIEKKRGLGAGKVNGPGGRIDAGETAEQAAIRETREEVGVRVWHPRWLGVLSFAFLDGYSLRCYVYRCDGFDGELMETPEAKPFWVPISEIPFERMWQDDILWMEHLLADRYFVGRFCFDGDVMLRHEVRQVEQLPGQEKLG